METVPRTLAPALEASRSSVAVNLDAVVREIISLQKTQALDFTLRLGELIVQRFYRGDVMKLRQRGPKIESLRQLSKHRDLPVSASTLFRAVALYELVQRLGGHQLEEQGLVEGQGVGGQQLGVVATWKHLSISHLRCVLGLPESSQTRLLARAEEEQWSVARCEAEVGRIKQSVVSRGGRPKLPRFVKSLRKLRDLADRPQEHFGDLEQYELLPDYEKWEVRRVLTELRGILGKVEAELPNESFEPAADEPIE